MYDYLLDKINVSKSKHKERLVFIKNDWSNDLNIPLLIVLFPITWFIYHLYSLKPLSDHLLYFHIISFILLIIGTYSFYINFYKARKLKTLNTDFSSEINRELVKSTLSAMNVTIFNNNKQFQSGVYKKSFPFDQIITILYINNIILINSRNVCIGWNGKMGRPPFGLYASKKFLKNFKKELKKQIDSPQLCH